MKRLILSTLLLVACALGATAQNELYIYQHSGVTDTLQLGDVKSVSHLRTGLDGRQHDDYVVMSVAMQDETVRSYLLADLDSVVMTRDGERIRLTRFVGGSNVNGDGTLRNKKPVPLKTSMDGDFMASASTVDFYWEDGDNIYIRPEETVMTADSVFIRTAKETAEFYFKSGNISGEEVTVYYPGQAPPSTDGQKVRVKSNQSQDVSNTTVHIGTSGDCGTAVARKPEGKSYYYFDLEHKAAYLCFLPYIANDLGRTVLKKVTVRSDKAIAGVFDLTTDGLTLASEDNEAAHTITLTTGGNAGFVLPKTANQSTSAYMVIAPQATATRLTCEFTVYDTVLESEGVYTKMIDLTEIAPNMVYVVKANCNNYVVDLGLPVKFLNHNMGAFAPEDYGGYYAYGELNDKGNYTSGNYTYQSVAVKDMPHEIRLTEKDVAHMRLGLSFSMPTNAEMRMLTDSCTWTWTTLNGHNGYKVKGKNDNYLFLPASGYRNGTGNNEITTRGLYRTSTLTAYTGYKCNWYLNFYSNSHDVNPSGDDVWLGESVRPVMSGGVQMTDGTVVQTMTDSVRWHVGATTARLFGTQYGKEKAKTAVEIGFIIGTREEVAEGNGTKLVGTLAEDNRVFYADFSEVAENTEYFYRAYVKTADDSLSYANILQFGNIYVDLGLPSGTKWANVNVGALSPEQDGDYFAWAETGKKATYNASTCRWYQNSTYLQPDDLREVQATRYDVAAQAWGGAWLTPTKADFDELVANTTATSTTLQGVKGYRLTSKVAGYTDRSIFVPCSGYREGGQNDYTSRSCLLSTTIRSSENFYGWYLNSTSTNDGWYRYHGLTARAVWKPQINSKSGRGLFIRTLPARKFFDGTTECDTLKAVVRNYTGDGTVTGIRWWRKGQTAVTAVDVAPDAEGYLQTVITGLTPGETYCYAAYIDNGTDEPFVGDTLVIDAVGLVDLGLSVKWANVNLGAENEGACGELYSWGTTVPYRNLSRYHPGTWDITPESGYDIVYNRWGPTFRLPTMKECQELIDNTTQTWTTRDGYAGCLFTSKKEGYTDRSVFIPAAGYYYGDRYYDQNNNADYWTSTVSDANEAYDLNFTNTIMHVYAHNKYQHGFSIRGVQDKVGYVRTCPVRRNMKGVAETDSLTGYFRHSSAGDVSVGFVLGDNANITVATAQKLEVGTVADGYFHYEKTGLSAGQTYYYRAYAYDGATYRYGDAVRFELVQMVDLDLPSGRLWANVDLGAGVPEDLGDYYAWGELQPKDSYTLDNYQFYQNNAYVHIGHDIGGSEYDAATMNMSHLWRLPTREECEELCQHCDWSQVTVGGVSCWKAASKTHPEKFVYFPPTHLREGMGWYTSYGGQAIFMASNLHSDPIEHCLYLYGDNHVAGTNNGEMRYRGMAVRPVVTVADTLSAGVIAHVETQDCQWTIGAMTATLHGNVTVAGAATGLTCGFIIGTIQEVETTTPASVNVFPVGSREADGSYLLSYAYDGSPKFYRAYYQVDGTYYLGAIRAITAADLMDVEFDASGKAFNGAATRLPIRQHGTTTCSYNATYKRHEVSMTSNSYGGYNYNFYDISFERQTDFMSKLVDGHTVEALFMMPSSAPNNNESSAFSCYYNGGSGVGVKNQKLYATFFLDGAYRFIYSDITPIAGLYYHVVGVWNKDEHKLHLYVDGVEAAEPLTVGDTFTQPDRPFFTVGGYPLHTNYAYYGWNGTVTFGRVYDKPLTATDVSRLYEGLTK